MLVNRPHYQGFARFGQRGGMEQARTGVSDPPFHLSQPLEIGGDVISRATSRTLPALARNDFSSFRMRPVGMALLIFGISRRPNAIVAERQHANPLTG